MFISNDRHVSQELNSDLSGAEVVPDKGPVSGLRARIKNLVMRLLGRSEEVSSTGASTNNTPVVQLVGKAPTLITPPPVVQLVGKAPTLITPPPVVQLVGKAPTLITPPQVELLNHKQPPVELLNHKQPPVELLNDKPSIVKNN